jgi:glycosyltransferase involved in cell wall biosynthesis
MRIIVLLSSFFTGGAEFSTLSFYGWLKTQGHTIKIVCCKKAVVEYNPKIFGLDDTLILPVTSFNIKHKMMNGIISDFKPQLLHSVLFEANILGRFCKYSNPSVVHLESLVNEVYSPHRLSDPNITRMKLKAYQFFDWLTQLRGVDHYHANGISVAKHYQKKININPKRISIIPRGRNANIFLDNAVSREQIRKEFNVPEQALLLINVGRQEYQKGQEVLIKALSALHSDLYRCLIVGREGSQTEVLYRMRREFNLQGQIIFAGHRNDVQQLLAASDIFIFPSRFEGLPGAMIEAEASALPIICSDIPNNHEVASNENAIFFDLADSESLTKHIHTLIHNRNMLKSMANKSLLIFNANFTITSVHQRMKGLLESLIDQK